MNNNYIELIKQSLENPETLDQEEIERLILQTGDFLKGLQETFEKGGPEAKEKALAQASDLNALLQAYLQQLSPFAGINPTDEDKTLVDQGLDINPLKINHKLKPLIMS